jgi:hypothetical protein
MTNEKMLEVLRKGNLKELEVALIENIREEVEKGKGNKKSDLSIIKRICEFEKGYNDNRWACYHPFTHNGIEYKGFLQGHYIIASQNDFGYPVAETPFKIAEMLKLDNDFNLEVDMKDLKIFIKTNSKKDKKPYIISYIDTKGNIQKIGFNPYYLIDALQFNETTTILISTPKKPAFIENKEKKTLALILPVNLA